MNLTSVNKKSIERSVEVIFPSKKVCVKGESNPQLNLGRVPCYHYTINALRVATAENTVIIIYGK